MNLCMEPALSMAFTQSNWTMCTTPLKSMQCNQVMTECPGGAKQVPVYNSKLVHVPEPNVLLFIQALLWGSAEEKNPRRLLWGFII